MATISIGKWSFMTLNKLLRQHHQLHYRVLQQIGLIVFLLVLPIASAFAQSDDDPCVQHPSKNSEKLFKKARDLQKAAKKSGGFGSV